MKKKSKSRQNKNRWNELSESLRELHPSCEVCNSKDHLQVHHMACSKFYKKSLLRWDPANLVVVCPRCHFVAHKSSLQFMRWFQKNREHDYLRCLSFLGDL